MDTPRLATSVWVSALLRRSNAMGDFGAVLRRGDATAGALALLLRRADGLVLMTPARDGEGRPIWLQPAGDRLLDEAESASWLARATRIDADLWIIEIEDRAGRVQAALPAR